MTAEAILLSGDFQFGRLGDSYERAFQQLGHTVHRFDIVAQHHALGWPARNRYLHRLGIRSLAARRAWSRQFNRNLVEAAQRCDAPWLFIHNGEWLMPETVRTLRGQGRRVVIFHADNPFPPHYANRPETLLAAREADLYLVWSDRLVERLRRDGVNARFLAFAWDPEAFPYHGEIPQGSKRVVSFIGGWDREREAFLDQIAAKVPLEIHGPGYWGTRTRSNSRARACWQGRALDTTEAAKVMRESAVCLNILRTQHVIDGQPDGVIMRHFEVPGAGGFLLSTRSGGATRLFPEGESAEYFSDASECAEKCVRYLDDSHERPAIATRAHDIVREDHTYVHRACEVVEMLKEAPCSTT
jgi:hypothetical protein